MGFLSGMKKVGGMVFNFRVNQWIGLDHIKSNSKNLYNIGQAAVTPEQPDHEETFEEALKRLNITEDEVKQRKIEFTRLMIIYIFVALLVFSYSIYIVVVFKNFMGFFMGLAVTLFALVHSFKYHFWLYQIRHRKLGCTLKDWFLDKP